jgi:tetratricopeptide (TPR) repeat protein
MRRAAQLVIAQAAEPTAHDYLLLATACRNLSDLDAAAVAATKALESHPSLPEALLAAAGIAGDRGDSEAALLHYRNLATHAPENPRWTWELIRLYVMLGRIGEAAIEVGVGLARWPTDPLLWGIAVDAGFRTLEDAMLSGVDWAGHGLYTRLFERAPAEKDLLRPLMVDHKLSDCIIAPAADRRIVVFVFTTTNDTFSMPLPIFDRYLAALGVTAVYLKDFKRLRYLKGIGSIGIDYDATIAALRRLLVKLGTSRVCAIGDSDGGFAAIRYGVALGADRIVSFSGPTHWIPEFDVYPMLSKHLAANVSTGSLDLNVFLTKQRHHSEIALLYGDASPRDRIHAIYLNGHPGVTLHPVAGLDDHDVLRWLALNADLRALLSSLLAVSPLL